jgi:hypothetical protein
MSILSLLLLKTATVSIITDCARQFSLSLFSIVYYFHLSTGLCEFVLSSFISVDEWIYFI